MRLDILKQGHTPWELRRFRYEVYVKEMNRRQMYANHDDQTITDPLDSFSTNIVARDGDNIVGCLRTSFFRDGDLGYYKDFYRINDYFSSVEGISIVTQLMTSIRCRKYRALGQTTRVFARAEPKTYQEMPGSTPRNSTWLPPPPED